MPFWKWSHTASSNALADNTVNWAEGMAPSAVNDSARAMMARLAEWRDDVSGTIITAGASTAYTVASSQGFDNLLVRHGTVGWSALGRGHRFQFFDRASQLFARRPANRFGATSAGSSPPPNN